MHEGLRNYFYNTLYKVSKGKYGITIVSFYRPLYLASAYIITKEGAEKLLKINTPIFLTADRLPNYARGKDNKHESKNKKFKMKAISPLITEQQREIFDSNIVPRIIHKHDE